MEFQTNPYLIWQLIPGVILLGIGLYIQSRPVKTRVKGIFAANVRRVALGICKRNSIDYTQRGLAAILEWGYVFGDHGCTYILASLISKIYGYWTRSH